MGFLSSLFKNSGRSNEDDDEEEEEEIEEESTEDNHAASGFPTLNEGMSLNVTLQNGQPLLSGQLASFTQSTMTLERTPGQFSFATCNIGSTVYIKGINQDSVPVDLKGIVEDSSRIQLRLKNVKVVPRDEQRSNFRLPLDTAVTLYYQEDERMQNPEQCKLVNLSTGGACIQSEYIHCEGEVLRLKFQIEDYAPMTFLGEIIRVEEPSHGVFRYGFLFAKLNDNENMALTRMLFNIQVGNKHTHRRDDVIGHW